jgi:hypothetical protein
VLPDSETRPRGAARTGLLEMSCDADSNPSHIPPPPRFQAPSQVARRRLLVARLHRLGPAPLAHFLGEIDRGAPIDATLEAYARLPAEFVLAYGGDKFPEQRFGIRGGR